MIKQNLFKLAICGLLAIFLSAQTSFADDHEVEEPGFGLVTTVGFYSDYMFRGKNVYDGLSIQPSVTAFYDTGEFGSLIGNVWLQAPAETSEPPEKFNELDSTIEYNLTVDIATLKAGFIFYTFPGGDGRIRDTQEYFAGVSLDMILNPSFTFFNDFNAGEYQYYTLRFDETLWLSDIVGEDEGASDLAITPYVLLGFATNADDGPVFYLENGLEHVDAGISTEFSYGPVFVTPNLNFTFEVDDAVENEFWMGVDFGVAL